MNTKKERGKIDWMITLVPLAIVIALCVLFFFAPEQSNTVLLAGTATTFSVATPLMATIISEMLHVAVSRTVINIIILLIAFCVDSVEQTVNELAEAGIECEPIRVDDYTGKKMTFFHDPDGLPLELHE